MRVAGIELLDIRINPVTSSTHRRFVFGGVWLVISSFLLLAAIGYGIAVEEPRPQAANSQLKAQLDKAIEDRNAQFGQILAEVRLTRQKVDENQKQVNDAQRKLNSTTYIPELRMLTAPTRKDTHTRGH